MVAAREQTHGLHAQDARDDVDVDSARKPHAYGRQIDGHSESDHLTERCTVLFMPGFAIPIPHDEESQRDPDDDISNGKCGDDGQG